MKTLLRDAWYHTCVKVNPHGKQCPCDGHERLAVVIGVKSDSADSLMDGIHQKRVDTCRMTNELLHLKQRY